MIFAIIFISISLTGLIIGAQFVASNVLFSSNCYESKYLDSPKIKIAAIALLALDAYNIIQSIRNLVNAYPADWTAWGGFEEEIGIAFGYAFTLILSCLRISLPIFLLIKKQGVSILSAASIVILSTINPILFHPPSLLNCYLSIFPDIVVYSSLAIVMLEFDDVFGKYTKLLKIAPFLVLLQPLQSIVLAIQYEMPFIQYVLISVIKFISVWIVLNVFVKKTLEMENETKKSSTIEILIAVILLLLIPIIIWLLSTINKIWMFVALTLMIIAVPVILISTKDDNGKTRATALICTFAVIVGICAIARFIPSGNNEEFDPDKCYWCDGMGLYMIEEGGKLYRCSHCNGTGKRN